MLERAELDYIAATLSRQLADVAIEEVLVRRLIVLRSMVEGTADQILRRHRVRAVQRRAGFLLLDVDGPSEVEMVLNLMDRGRLAIVPAAEAPPREVVAAFRLSDQNELRVLDAVQRAKIYLIRRGSWRQVPGLLDPIGVDVLDRIAFSPAAFRALVLNSREPARAFLLDRSVVDFLAPAAADQILWQAGIHPRTAVGLLQDDEIERLHHAIPSIVAEQRAILDRERPPLAALPQDGDGIGGRAGELCSRCATALDSVRILTTDAVFCPTCQRERRPPGAIRRPLSRGDSK